MRSIMAVSAVPPISPISPITRSRPVRAEEQPMDQEDVFCPRDVTQKSWDYIGKWIYEAGNMKCQTCSHKKKCAGINRNA